MELTMPQLDARTFSCSICLEPLNEPVTSPCGHNFCCSCIQANWDMEANVRDSYSCPECRENFAVRPNLAKNTMLAALVKELKKSAGRKPLALVCDGPPLKEHKPTVPLFNEPQWSNICSSHGEAVQLLRRKDATNTCYLCSLVDHRDHEEELAWAKNRQEIEAACHGIRQRIRSKEEDMELLQQTLWATNECADRAVTSTEKIFDKMFHLLKKSRAKVWQQIRSVQDAKASLLKERQEKLEQDIVELARKEAELTKMQLWADKKPLVGEALPASTPMEPAHPSSVRIRPRWRLKGDGAVTELSDVLQRHLVEKWSDIPWSVINVDVLLTKADPESCRRNKRDKRRTCS